MDIVTSHGVYIAVREDVVEPSMPRSHVLARQASECGWLVRFRQNSALVHTELSLINFELCHGYIAPYVFFSFRQNWKGSLLMHGPENGAIDVEMVELWLPKYDQKAPRTEPDRPK